MTCFHEFSEYIIQIYEFFLPNTYYVIFVLIFSNAQNWEKNAYFDQYENFGLYWEILVNKFVDLWLEKLEKTCRELDNSRQFMGFTCLCEFCKEENDELDEEQTAMQSKVVTVCSGFLSCKVNHVSQLGWKWWLYIRCCRVVTDFLSYPKFRKRRGVGSPKMSNFLSTIIR